MSFFGVVALYVDLVAESVVVEIHTPPKQHKLIPYTLAYTAAWMTT